MRAKIKKNNLIILGLVFLLIIIVVGQSSTAFIGATEQPTAADLEKFIQTSKQLIIDKQKFTTDKIDGLKEDIETAFFGIGNDVRGAGIEILEKAQKIMIVLNKKLLALEELLADMKAGKKEFNNNQIKNIIKGINNDLITLRNYLGHSEKVIDPITGEVTIIYHGFNDPMFAVMSLEAKKDLGDVIDEVIAKMNESRKFNNGILPITEELDDLKRSEGVSPAPTFPPTESLPPTRPETTLHFRRPSPLP
jgi:hypothetical protein